MVKIRCWSRGIIFQLMQDESFRDQLIVLLTVCSFLCLYDPMDYSCLGSSVHGIFFFRQEYWSLLLFPPPRDLPDPGIKPESPVDPAFADGFLTSEPPGKSKNVILNT